MKTVALSTQTSYTSPMIKNTLVVNQTEAAQNYFDSMMDHLNMSREDLHFKEFTDDLQTLSAEVSRLMSTDLRVARQQFAELFRMGSTMMLVPSDDFEALEKWSVNDEDFRVVVFTENGEPIGAFGTDQVQW